MRSSRMVLLAIVLLNATAATGAFAGPRATHHTKVATAEKADPKCAKVCPNTGQCLVR